MLDLICVSSVLIVCSSLHFTWRKERKKGIECPTEHPRCLPHPAWPKSPRRAG